MKRKSKLFLSLASMMFAVALLCFGVYAALSVTYTISGSVVYEVKDVFVNIQTSVYVSTLGTLTDNSSLHNNVSKFEEYKTNSDLESLLSQTNTAKTDYSYKLEYKDGDATSEPEKKDIPINYGSYKIENQGQENEYAQGFAYYIVVNIKNYGTEQVGVDVQNNIDAQNINSIVAVTKSTNIDARGENDYSEKNIVIALALDDATKSVSNVTFSLPIKISRTLVQEQTYGTISNSQGTYNIGSDDVVTFTSEVQDYLAIYNFTLSDVPQNMNWLNLNIITNADILLIIKGEYSDYLNVQNVLASFEHYVNTSVPIKISDLLNEEDINFAIIWGYTKNTQSESSLTISWSELREDMQLKDFEQIGTTYWGIGYFMYIMEQRQSNGWADWNPVGFSLEEMEEFMLNYVINTTKIDIPMSVTTIGQFAFSNCSSLSEITIPQSVTTIGYGAFQDCSSLSEITIPQSVTTIGNDAFSGCKFTKVKYERTGTGYTFKDGVLTINAMQNKPAWYTDNINPLITEVVWNCSPTSIGNYAFYGCSRLQSVDLSDCTNLTTIGDSAFSSCSSLIEITIPQSVETIGDYAFHDCSSLIEITIPQSVETIGEWAFQDCSSLSEITIPQSVTTIGGHAFYGCSRLNTVVIDNLNIANAITVSASQGHLLYYLKPGTGVVKVKCSSLEDVTSKYLTNTFNFTATYQDGYAVFTKK